MALKTYFILILALFGLPLFGENKLCPIMVEDEIDEEEVVVFEGKKVFLCCGGCVKKWNKSPKYYIKAMADMLPQFKGMENQLRLDEVELMAQKFCPVYQDRVVTPESPSVELNGKKVFLYSTGAVKRWNRDPEKYIRKAVQLGILPQDPKNRKIKGMTNPVKTPKSAEKK
tara:strand:- start:280 stop:792 length:513 start_codon:yes stop_codon:yes gene_type:complete